MLISRRGNLLFFGVLLSISLIHNVRAYQNSIPNPNCAKNGEYCQTHNECCSGKCMTYSYICAPVIRPEIMSSPPENNYVQANWWISYFDRPTIEQIEIATLPDDKSNTDTHAVEKVDSSVITTNLPQVHPTDSRTCKNIGNECSDNRECCSLRCHSYLHRCVT